MRGVSASATGRRILGSGNNNGASRIASMCDILPRFRNDGARFGRGIGKRETG